MVASKNGWERVVGSSTSRLKLVSGTGAGTDAQDRLYIGSAELTQEGANPGAVLMGYGNSTTRVISPDANAKFLSFYTEGNGDGQYGAYFRHYISTAALSNDCLRAFGTVNNVAANTARGAHISLSFGDTGTVTGLGCALEATLHLPNTTPLAGTLAAINAAINSDGATSDPAGATSLAVIRAVNQGNATGMADVDDDAVFIDFSGWTVGDGNMIAVKAAGAAPNVVNSIRIRLPDGTLAYIMASASPLTA